MAAGDRIDPEESLFTPSKEFTVMGPTRFPKPTDMLGRDAEIVVHPTFGHHRADQDAVMAYAEGYELVHYLVFVQSLLSAYLGSGDWCHGVHDFWKINSQFLGCKPYA